MSQRGQKGKTVPNVGFYSSCFLALERFSLQIKNNVLKLKQVNKFYCCGHNVLIIERYSLIREKNMTIVKRGEKS